LFRRVRRHPACDKSQLSIVNYFLACKDTAFFPFFQIYFAFPCFFLFSVLVFARDKRFGKWCPEKIKPSFSIPRFTDGFRVKIFSDSLVIL
jgi:hypothetical protein